MTYIYALLCPISGDVRYVGKAGDLRQRYRDHLFQLSMKSPKVCWIASLKKKGLRPLMSIIEVVSDTEWEVSERYWISYYREKGARLLNLRPGGEGSPKGVPLTLETREKMRGPRRPHSDEHRRKIGDAQRWRRQSDAQKENLRVKTQGRKLRNSSSSYVGVSWCSSKRRWKAHIRSNGKLSHLGYFDIEVEAALAYNRAALDIFGPAARLNEVKG